MSRTLLFCLLMFFVMLGGAYDGMGLFSITPTDLVEGKWRHGFGGYWAEASLEISSGTMSWKYCRGVPFTIILDKKQTGVEQKYADPRPGGPASFRYDLREIALELKRGPKCKLSDGPLGDVVVFPITNLRFPESTLALCTSRVRVYQTRADFHNSQHAAEVPLDNDACKFKHGLTPRSSGRV